MAAWRFLAGGLQLQRDKCDTEVCKIVTEGTTRATSRRITKHSVAPRITVCYWQLFLRLVFVLDKCRIILAPPSRVQLATTALLKLSSCAKTLQPSRRPRRTRTSEGLGVMFQQAPMSGEETSFCAECDGAKAHAVCQQWLIQANCCPKFQPTNRQ